MANYSNVIFFFFANYILGLLSAILVPKSVHLIHFCDIRTFEILVTIKKS